jgi:hypothetical protein
LFFFGNPLFRKVEKDPNEYKLDEKKTLDIVTASGWQLRMHE